MKRRAGFALVCALSMSSLALAEEKTEDMELNVYADVLVCTPGPEGSVTECAQPEQSPEQLAKDILISLRCRKTIKNCSGDWDFSITKGGHTFPMVVNITKETNSEDRAEYTISAGLFFLNSIRLTNGNQLTDSVVFLSQILHADQKVYLLVIGISPKGKHPTLTKHNF